MEGPVGAGDVVQAGWDGHRDPEGKKVGGGQEGIPPCDCIGKSQGCWITAQIQVQATYLHKGKEHDIFAQFMRKGPKERRVGHEDRTRDQQQRVY